ncbi:MAG: glycoside hydrolase family 15 protein [Vulcanimicrobiaceae bacterium]
MSASAARNGPAPGGPGIASTWSSSAKDAVGTSLCSSRIWFTLGFGILNEVFYPNVDTPQLRDLGFIVADSKGFWAEVKRLDDYELTAPEPGIPAYTIVHRHERFTLTLRVCSNSYRDALLIDAHLEGQGLRLYALLAPHLSDRGMDNKAVITEHGRWTALVAQRSPYVLALLAGDENGDDAISRANCGYVGESDTWQDFHRNGAMTWTYESAGPGNVALACELPAQVTLSLAFGNRVDSAVTLAASCLAVPFDDVWHAYIENWRQWFAQIGERARVPDDFDQDLLDEAVVSAAVLKTHQDKVFRGAMVASLSIPWGQSRDDVGGYHLVWIRDLVESAGALLAIGDDETARDILRYVIATQRGDGRWSQNQWLNGAPYWSGFQLDEAGFPILLASMLREREALGGVRVKEMVRRAATLIAREGPLTGQDRWEEDAGLNPFTLAITISALVCAADFLDGSAKEYALELADVWNSQIEAWTYVEGTALADRFGVHGYYVRTTPPEALDSRDAICGRIPIKNRPSGSDSEPASQVVGLEFLELVRMGLRRFDDPRIMDSVVVADGLLRVETPSGPVWHRYPDDGYGEHEDGSPFDGTGIGRGWPLLTGERGHYAVACGQDGAPYLRAMLRMASRGGMIPEQVWDAPVIPECRLYPGRPTGSAMPLVWAHSEFLKLCASLGLGRAFDRSGAVWARYQGQVPSPSIEWWRYGHAQSWMRIGKTLRIETLEPALVHVSFDGWQSIADVRARDLGLGVFVADLATERLPVGTNIDFTLYWLRRESWEGRDFRVEVAGQPVDS